MKLLIDMNLAPAWVGFLAEHGFDSIHWSTVGYPRDAAISPQVAMPLPCGARTRRSNLFPR